MEEHHIAGRLNNGDYTVKVCSRCNNGWLKAWHYVHRVPLGKEERRTEYVSGWAMCMGTLHILETFTRRWGMVGLPHAIRVSGQLFTRLIGSGAGEDMPEPKSEKLRKNPPVKLVETSLPGDAEMLATMTAYIAGLMFGDSSIITRLFVAVARDPESFIEWCESHADWAGNSLRALADAIESRAGLATLKRETDTIRGSLVSLAIDYLEDR
ncbi:hypothetical protein [Streptomyces sp. NPDC051677]|uniref:hypothetical protein n=1 Tax=Streptomyces sp. NPDC051677 TaxID=3365669 RepID=UPI0037D12EA9